MSTRFKILLTTFLILGSLYFLFIGLTQGKAFLVPLVTAIILSMLMNPVANKLIQWGLGRGWAVLVSDLIIILVIAAMMLLLAAQANNVIKNWDQIETNIQPKIDRVQKFYDEHLKSSLNQLQNGVLSQSEGQSQESGNEPKQEEQNQAKGQAQPAQEEAQTKSEGAFSTENIRNLLTGILQNIFGFFSNLLLVLVYIFFFMFYKKKFEDAIVGLVPKDQKDRTRTIIHDASKIAQKYLFGRFILIAMLAVLYTIAFSISGLEHAIFIALLAALFSLLPFIGNVLALGLALVMSFIGGGETGQIIIIVISFSIIQFVESYILEPYVVGDKVDLNPVIIIVGVVLGGLVWGVMGMILVIPILGILKVVFDSIESLRPFGYVLDERGISSDDDVEGWADKVKGWFKKKG